MHDKIKKDLNMQTSIMVKADKSRATKTGHFYLLLTQKPLSFYRFIEWLVLLIRYFSLNPNMP